MSGASQLESFDYFGANPFSYYTHARFRVVSVSLKYFAESSHRRLSNWWASLVQLVLHVHGDFGQRFLAYLIGGIDEIQVTLEAEKFSSASNKPPSKLSHGDIYHK